MRLREAILFAVALCSAQGGCSKRAPGPSYADGGPFMPETIGALSLGDSEAFPPEIREAAKAASSYFSQRGMSPELHFAQFAIRGQNHVELAVWPAAAFSLKGRPRSSGGGGVTLHFNPTTGRIERSLKWQ